jgi:hypothetical protein
MRAANALAVGYLLAFVPLAPAAVIYSGVRNLPVPADPVGLYLNVVTGGFETPAPFIYPSGPAINWDINLGGSGLRFFTAPNNGGQNPMGVAASQKGYIISSTDQAANLAPGTLISAASNIDTFGPAADNLATGLPAIFGFRFRNETDPANLTTHYGWARVILTDGQPGTLVDYAYESTPNVGIAAGAVPEPAGLGVLLGLGALLTRRRRS